MKHYCRQRRVLVQITNVLFQTSFAPVEQCQCRWGSVSSFLEEHQNGRAMCLEHFMGTVLMYITLNRRLGSWLVTAKSSAQQLAEPYKQKRWRQRVKQFTKKNHESFHTSARDSTNLVNLYSLSMGRQVGKQATKDM